jgi:hypothetical protein
MSIKKDEGIEGLVLGGLGNLALHGRKGKKIDHMTVRKFPIGNAFDKTAELAYPSQIGLFGTIDTPLDAESSLQGVEVQSPSLIRVRGGLFFLEGIALEILKRIDGLLRLADLPVLMGSRHLGHEPLNLFGPEVLPRPLADRIVQLCDPKDIEPNLVHRDKSPVRQILCKPFH